MIKKLLTALALASSLSCQAFTANELLSWYEKGGEPHAFARGFILGVWHTMGSCTPPGVDLGQVSDVVVMGMKKLPQYRHFEANAFVQVIISTEWKCKAGEAKKSLDS